MPPGHGPSNRFPKCTEDGKIVELARPIELAIVGHGTSNDQGTPVVVEGGTNRGIDKTWRATLLDANQREMADARIAGLEPDAIEVLAPMAAERIDNFARSVRFTPPENTRLVIPTAQPKVEPIVLSVVRIGAVDQRGTHIVVAGGTNRGIDRSWRAVVLDPNQRPLPNGEASFIRLDRTRSELVVRMTVDEIASSGRAIRVTPPWRRSMRSGLYWSVSMF